MRKPKAILFDLGDTIIMQSSGDFLKGTQTLLEYSDRKQDAVLIQEYASKLEEEIKNVKEVSHFENSCRAFMKFLYEYHQVNFSISLEELEIIFNRVAFKRHLADDFYEYLNYLKSNDIRVAILSNTTFSEKTLRDELSIYDLEDAFEFVISTADYGIRKPDSRIFQLALNKLILEADTVWYIGNSFKYDVIGAHDSGIQPIWFNHEKNKPLKDLPYYECNSYLKLIEAMEALDE
ncbi:MAG: HAD family hydrolase [Clostridia bacterium]|nr:HAD family hydrolase [Clostridia bacterium]